MKVALVQMDIAWEDAQANIEKLDSLLKPVVDEVDLVVLPEFFASGFSMRINQIHQTLDGEVVTWMKQKAHEHNCAILGSLPLLDEGKHYNAALFVKPDGTIAQYNKRHLFCRGGENDFFEPGDSKIIIEYMGVRIAPFVCYDIRFPVWCRNVQDYDLLIYVANWPTSRLAVWNVLMQARAIENQCYTIGVNRIGEGGGIKYTGGTMLIDCRGRVRTNLDNAQEIVTVEKLDFSQQSKFRREFPVLEDRDTFTM